MTRRPREALPGRPESRTESDGWRVVAAGFLGLTLVNGVRAAFGLFLPFMVADIGFSLTYGSFAFWLHWTGYALGCVVLGQWIDRRGVPLRMIRLAAVSYGGGLVVLAIAREPWQVLVLFGVLGGIAGSLMGSVPANVSVSRWFVRRRGLALGVTNTGVGFGVTVLPLVAGWVIAVSGWRAGWAVLGLLAALVMTPLASWFAPPPEPAAVAAAAGGAGPAPPLLRTVSFWALFGAFLLGLVAQYGAWVHLPGQALGLGITAAEVAAGMALAGVANVAARLVFGWTADRLRDRTLVVVPGTALYVVGILLAAGMASRGQFVVAVVLVGAGVAVYGPLYGMIVADRFDAAILGRAFGTLTVGAGIGGAGGPVLVGAMLDAGAAYTTVWRIMALAGVLAVPLFFLKRLPWTREGALDDRP